jgi:hypothetical protein
MSNSPSVNFLFSTKPSEILDMHVQKRVAMEETTQASPDWLDMGAWVGRQQAFAVIANQCSAAQALSLKQIKETSCHDKLGLSWDEFCRRHIGLSRRQADRIVSQYNVSFRRAISQRT